MPKAEQSQNKVIDLRSYQKGNTLSKSASSDTNTNTQPPGTSQGNKAGKSSFFHSKKNLIAFIVFIVLILSIGGALAYFSLTGNDFKNEVNHAGKNGSQDSSQLVEVPLNGVYASADMARRIPIGVMIENLVTIRPQIGLDKANIIFEALAEGGITRFLVFYVEQRADQIGPVRSARQYYLDWMEETHGLYVHAGGSPWALSAIPDYNFFDMSALGNDGKYFWRDNTDSAPHNLYTKHDLIELGIRDKGIKNIGKYESWEFKNEDTSLIGELDGHGERFKQATDITLDFSSESYEVRWEYDKDKNEYKRFNGGQPHTERRTGDQLRSKNIAVAKVRAYPRDEQRLQMETLEGGDAIVFRDGVAFEGTWKKEPNRDDRLRFYDVDGKEIEFNRGVTWIEIIPPDREIKY